MFYKSEFQKYILVVYGRQPIILCYASIPAAQPHHAK